MNLHEVVKDYEAYLQLRGRTKEYAAFSARLKTSYESCIAEAVVFNLIAALGWRPRQSDEHGVGGADFVCQTTDGARFHVEATGIEVDTITNFTGMRPGPYPGRYDTMRGIGPVIFWKVIQKYKQVARIVAATSEPLILGVVCLHPESGDMLMFHGIEDVVSSPGFPVFEGGAFHFERQATDLHRSVFFKFDEQGAVIPRRGAISGLLIVTIGNEGTKSCVVLNPEAKNPISPGALLGIPKVVVTVESTDRSAIVTEWIPSRDLGSVTFEPFWKTIPRGEQKAQGTHPISRCGGAGPAELD